MADIPGIIEGAHEGKGIGLRFLRHIERNSILLFMVPVDSDDIRKEYEILLNELRQFNPELLDKSRVLAITKADLADAELTREMKKDVPDVPFVFISSHKKSGLNRLKSLLWDELTRINAG
jgi:GTP-binding protein